MKRLMSSLIALACVASLPAAGFAQDRRTTDNRVKKERPAWSNTQNLHESKDLIGAKVFSTDGAKELGELDALLIDPKDGKVTHAVVGYGGRLGFGEEKVVVPYSAMKMTGHEGGKKAKITMDQSALENAPKYVKTTDRAPSASPATFPRRDADGKPLADKPPTKGEKIGANQTDAQTPDKKY